jgi:hypothetical protein
MQVGQIYDKPRDFVATIDFALNWDDKKMKSVKVRSGECISYDGAVAFYKDTKTAEEFKGPCHGLKSAIEVMHWLIPKNGKVKEVLETKDIQTSRKDYDDKVGGSFDTFMAKDQATVVAPKKYSLIQEKDVVVKELTKFPAVQEKKGERLEVVGDQVAVKDKLIIRSSTTEVRSSKFNAELIKGDEGSSEGTIPLKMQKKSNEKVKKTFTVDETTPRNISDDLTMDEVQRMKGVIKADDSQDARVVGKIKPSADVQQIEGITLKRPAVREEKPIKATVSRGGNEPVVNIQDDGVIVGKIKSQKEIDTEARSAAEEKKKKIEEAKQARLKAASATQALMEKEKAVVITTENPESVVQAVEQVSSEISAQEIVENKIPETPIEVVEASKIPVPESTDYLSQLPEDWGTMHWVKKEKFIKALTDKGFVEFILSVETIKAVQNACTERLKELG